MSEVPPSTVAKKIEQWKSRLIDLSKRNRLLYFRQTKTGSVQLIQPPAGDIFEWLVKKEKPMTFIWREKSGQTLQPFETEEGKGSPILKPGDLLTNLSDSDLSRVLYNVRLKSRAAMQEQGVNVLFVVFGLLEWTESQDSTIKLRSPLILAPAQLIREAVTKPYKVSLLDEDIVLNPTLSYVMRTYFGITLPPLPDDLDSINLEDIFNQIEQVIKEQPGWSILPETYIALLSFIKLVMYKDLETHAHRVCKHPIIAALAGDPSRLPSIPDDLPTAETLDERVHPEESFQVLDADSSQQEAIVAAKSGVSFVLQGPPGTGKSQTITNIIAECLAVGKTVLFVSEKMAALEVVKKRLDECGLGQFCLELHSYKASKQTVIEELGRVLDASGGILQVSDAELKQLEDLRERLNCYVRALHRPQSQLRVSAFRVHGELARLYDAPDLVFNFPDILQVSPGQYGKIHDILKRLVVMPQVLENYNSHPWYGCQIKSWSFSVQQEIRTHLEHLNTLLIKLSEVCSQLVELCALDKPQTLHEASHLCSLLEVASETPFPLKSWFAPSALAELIDQAKKAQAIYSDYLEGRESLLSRYRPDIMTLNASDLLSRFETDYRSIFRIFKQQFRQDIAMLRSLSTSQRKVGYAQALEDLRCLKAIQEGDRWIAERLSEHRRSFGKYFNGLETQWGNILSSLEWVKEFTEKFGLDGHSTLVEIVSERPNDVLAIRDLLRDLVAYLNKVEEELHFLGSVFSPDKLYVNGISIRETAFADLRDWLQYCLSNLDRLREWIDFQNAREEGEKYGLGSFISAARRRNSRQTSLYPLSTNGSSSSGWMLYMLKMKH